EHDQRLLVVEWLHGPTTHELLGRQQGRRTGELAAAWMRRAESLQVKLGKRIDVERVLRRAAKAVAALRAADPSLGDSSARLVGMLADTKPGERSIRVVHGALLDRTILDSGNGPGVIDWEHFGQGPPEFEAGKFLASIWHARIKKEALTTEAA